MNFFRFFGLLTMGCLTFGMQNVEWYAYVLLWMGFGCASLIWLNPDKVNK